jgi:hypothetical protein
VESASHVDCEDFVEMVFGYLAQRSELANASIGEQYVDCSSLILYDCEEPVEISKVRDVALNTTRIVPDLGHGSIQLALATPRHKHSRALCGKSLRRGETDTAIGAGNYGNLSLEPSDRKSH